MYEGQPHTLHGAFSTARYGATFPPTPYFLAPFRMMAAERKARDLDGGGSAVPRPSHSSSSEVPGEVVVAERAAEDSNVSAPSQPDGAKEHAQDNERGGAVEDGRDIAGSRSRGDRTSGRRHSGSGGHGDESGTAPKGAVSNGKEAGMRDSHGGGGGGDSGGGYFDDDDIDFDIDDLEDVLV